MSLVVARHTLEIGGGYTLRMMHPCCLDPTTHHLVFSSTKVVPITVAS